ncbi:hypothetical protein BGLA2_1240037 [Burkholderia gladioli]|nr:hypothetical protein BGLA2_1240037 [Burkholderia gladioli]
MQPAHVFDVQRWLDAQRFSRFQFAIATLCFAVVALDGLDTALIVQLRLGRAARQQLPGQQPAGRASGQPGRAGGNHLGAGSEPDQVPLGGLERAVLRPALRARRRGWRFLQRAHRRRRGQLCQWAAGDRRGLRQRARSRARAHARRYHGGARPEPLPGQAGAVLRGRQDREHRRGRAL